MSGQDHVPSPIAAAQTEAGSRSMPQHRGDDDDDDNDNDNHATPAPLPPRLDPFFTLVTNTTASTTIHPRVQYLFTDDDADPSALAASCAPTTRPLIVDLVPAPDNTSWSVSWASSLSPDFALTGSSITVQQDASAGGAAAPSDDRSTTLRLEGVERDAAPLPPPNPDDSAPATAREDLEPLADEFRRRMAVLTRVLAEGEKRSLAVEQQAQLQMASHHGNVPRRTADEVAFGAKSLGDEHVEAGPSI